jgi:hypothetical protein
MVDHVDAADVALAVEHVVVLVLPGAAYSEDVARRRVSTLAPLISRCLSRSGVRPIELLGQQFVILRDVPKRFAHIPMPRLFGCHFL